MGHPGKGTAELVALNCGASAQPGMGAPAPAPAAPHLGLSKAHISPPRQAPWTARVWEGGALVELKGPGVKGQTRRGARRGTVGPFTPASRLRLMRKMARVRCDGLPQFVTLTYPNEFIPEPAKWKRDLDALVKRLRRLFPELLGSGNLK